MYRPYELYYSVVERVTVSTYNWKLISVDHPFHMRHDVKGRVGFTLLGRWRTHLRRRLSRSPSSFKPLFLLRLISVPRISAVAVNKRERRRVAGCHFAGSIHLWKAPFINSCSDRFRLLESALLNLQEAGENGD